MRLRSQHLLRLLTVILTSLACHAPLHAQTDLTLEAQTTATTGDNTPLWLNANKYGLSSLKNTNGYVRASLINSQPTDSLHPLVFHYGLDVALASRFTSTLIVQQAYGELQWKKLLVTVGSKEQPLQLRNQQLSSGSQTLGVNARPVPSVRLSAPEYWSIPGTKNYLAVKGFLSYGLQTDDNWQKDFTDAQSKYTKHTIHHTKAGYLRIGNPKRTVTVEMGLEMGCLFGGTSYVFDQGDLIVVKNRSNLKAFFNAFVPGGGDNDEGIYKNKEGDHLGSYLLKLNIDKPTYHLGFYADHFFEDHSQMFFLDYDGYGEGEEYNEWKENRWLLYELHDIMLGAELHLKRTRWLTDAVCEYIYTKYQSGPVYHDRSPEMSDHIAGRDNYYNHGIYAGWQHWGQVLGNPLYRSPLYNSDGRIQVADNRFWAWHFGLGGNPFSGFTYRLLASIQKGWGTYDAPFYAPERNTSLLVEASYAAPEQSQLHGWSLKAGWGLDHGKLLGNNMGAQLTLARKLNLNNKHK